MSKSKDLSQKGRELNEDAQASLVNAEHEMMPLLVLSKKDEYWHERLKKVFKKLQWARRTLKKQRKN